MLPRKHGVVILPSRLPGVTFFDYRPGERVDVMNRVPGLECNPEVVSALGEAVQHHASEESAVYLGSLSTPGSR